METKYLLTVMWRHKGNGWNYLNCIHWSPTKYLLENWDGQMEYEHVILNSYQLSDDEYAELRDEITIEDFTRDE